MPNIMMFLAALSHGLSIVNLTAGWACKALLEDETAHETLIRRLPVPGSDHRLRRVVYLRFSLSLRDVEEQRQHRYLNNRAEVSRPPTRQQ